MVFQESLPVDSHYVRTAKDLVRSLVVGLLLMMISFIGNAQLSRGGSPLKSKIGISNVEWIELEDVKTEELLLEDEWFAITGKKNRRIAKEIQVFIRPGTNGTWEEIPGGNLVWKLGIRSRGASGMGLVFSRYRLEEGVKLYVYDPSMKKTLGAFTGQNNKISGDLALSYLPGDELILQLEVPAGINDFGDLILGSVRHAYLPVFEEQPVTDYILNKSGACNIDINCSLGDDWQIVKNSVVRMINVEKCTGVLINNTRQDEKAYVYTAAHCVFQNEKFQSTVFYFNYENNNFWDFNITSRFYYWQISWEICF